MKVSVTQKAKKIQNKKKGFTAGHFSAIFSFNKPNNWKKKLKNLKINMLIDDMKTVIDSVPVWNLFNLFDNLSKKVMHTQSNKYMGIQYIWWKLKTVYLCYLKYIWILNEEYIYIKIRINKDHCNTLLFADFQVFLAGNE